MSQEAFLDLWVGRLAGLYARYAYGIDTKLNERDLVHQLERMVGQMYHEARAQPQANGKVEVKK